MALSYLLFSFRLQGRLNWKLKCMAGVVEGWCPLMGAFTALWLYDEVGHHLTNRKLVTLSKLEALAYIKYPIMFFSGYVALRT